MQEQNHFQLYQLGRENHNTGSGTGQKEVQHFDPDLDGSYKCECGVQIVMINVDSTRSLPKRKLLPLIHTCPDITLGQYDVRRQSEAPEKYEPLTPL
jgi:hypothetical protein